MKKEMKGEVNIYNTVTYTPTGEVYGKLSTEKTDSEIKRILLIGNLTRLILSPFSFGARSLHLLSGHWAWKTGYEAGLKSWKIARYKALANSRSIPGKGNLAARVALYSLYYFGKSSFQLLTQPIQIALSLIVTIGSLFHSQYARRFQGKIDYFWKVDFEIDNSLRLGNYNIPVFLLITPMPCMLSNVDIDKINYHKNWVPYHPETVRSLALSLQSQLNDYKEIFSDEHFNQMLGAISHFRENVKQVSQSNSSEIDDNLELRKTGAQEITLTQINKSKEARKSLGEAQRALRDYIEKGGNISSLLDTFQAVKNEIPTTSTTN